MPQDENKVKKLAAIKDHNRTDEQWQAIYDARTLANAKVIEGDTDRYNLAKLWAGVILLDEKEETDALQKVADA